MTSMYNIDTASAITTTMADVSDLVGGTAGLLKAISQQYYGPEQAAIKVLASQIDMYRQALDIVIAHIDNPDLSVKSVFMPAKLRRIVLHECRNMSDPVDIGWLLECFTAVNIESAAAALRALVEQDQNNAALYEALSWLEMADAELSDIARTTYDTWNANAAA